MTRLINVDTLDNYLGKWADNFYDNPENSDADFMDGYCMTLNRIYSGAVPVVDAEPIRHGRWIDEGSFKYKHGGRNSEAKELFGTEWRTMQRIVCSLCNKTTLVDDTILYEYCPNCGAKMDGEQEKKK